MTLNSTFCSSDPAIDPGGRMAPPNLSPALLLDLRVRPRVQPYLEEDETGVIIIDAPVGSLSQCMMKTAGS